MESRGSLADSNAPAFLVKCTIAGVNSDSLCNQNSPLLYLLGVHDLPVVIMVRVHLSQPRFRQIKTGYIDIS